MMRVFVIIVGPLLPPLNPTIPNQRILLHLQVSSRVQRRIWIPTIQKRSSESRLHSSHLIVLPGVQYKMSPPPGSVNLIATFAGLGAKEAKIHQTKESILHNSTYLSQIIEQAHLYANCTSKCGNRKNLSCRVR